jgi:hypothetical protein
MRFHGYAPPWRKDCPRAISGFALFPPSLNKLQKKLAARTNSAPQRLKPDSFCGTYGTSETRALPDFCQNTSLSAACHGWHFSSFH